eukprot:scaffold226183_cov44-Tisochrysis_lutea.AAC.1
MRTVGRVARIPYSSSHQIGMHTTSPSTTSTYTSLENDIRLLVLVNSPSVLKLGMPTTREKSATNKQTARASRLIRAHIRGGVNITQ